MTALRRMLVPVDFSPSCAWAARYAAQMARRTGAGVTYLHVGAAHTGEELKAFLAPLVGDTPHQWEIFRGDPAERIVERARQTDADLIVMPTHSYGKYRRFLLGSVTAKVLHDTDCPVLTGVHTEGATAELPGANGTIVCALDATADALPLIRYTLNLCDAFEAKPCFVHAVAAVDETSDNPGMVEVRKYLFREASDKFQKLLREAAIHVGVTPAGGEPAKVLREAALRHNSALAVIGRGQTRSGWGRLRTNAYAIIRNSPCPVISV